MQGLGRVTKEPCTAIARITLEEGSPFAGGGVDCFKPLFTSRLDFELPEDYKHRCPIFRSRIIAFQHNFIRGSLVC